VALPETTLDRRKPYETRAERHVFAQSKLAELEYGRKLRQVAKNVGEFVKSLFPNGKPAHPGALGQLHQALRSYAEILKPWAAATAQRMIADVNRRDQRAWRKHGERMERALHREIAQTPIGNVVKSRLAAQVNLITSLPVEAAERVHKLTLAGLTGSGGRAKEIAAEIMKSGEVTASRATLIARTEVGRTSTEFTRARAEAVGSTHFVWMTAGDVDVRPLHKKLRGTVHRWDDPPIAGENGERYLPGSGPNCRCYASPVVPDVIL
jgi:SPP1 gp7 family putative phage head morphogenesis protein